LLYETIDAGHSGAALKWYLDLKENILSLEQHPNRCPVIRKKDRLRHLLFGRKKSFTSATEQGEDSARRPAVKSATP
jgi:hypothetical protein